MGSGLRIQPFCQIGLENFLQGDNTASVHLPRPPPQIMKGRNNLKKDLESVLFCFLRNFKNWPLEIRYIISQYVNCSDVT